MAIIDSVARMGRRQPIPEFSSLAALFFCWSVNQFMISVDVSSPLYRLLSVDKIQSSIAGFVYANQVHVLISFIRLWPFRQAGPPAV